MNKVFFTFLLVITSLLCTAQTLSVDSFKVKVNKDGLATCYLNNGKQLIIKAIVNPYYDKFGHAKGGSMENRQGLMLNAPIRPDIWEKNSSGNLVPVGFNYNTGFDSYSATIFVIEGTWNDDHTSITYNAIEQICSWGNLPDPSTWVKKYLPDTYEIPNFIQTVSVTKQINGRYFTN